MAHRDSYAPGTPCFVDVSSPDLDTTRSFYGQLFGWTGESDPRPEAGGYGMFELHGSIVAGFGPQMDESVPPSWTVYVSVPDVEATAARAIAHGGTVVVEPMDIFEAGRMAMVLDPGGAPVALWQPRDHIGAHEVNSPGTFVWNELASSSLAQARRFYADVFNWGEAEPIGDDAAIFTVDGEVVCGAHAAGEGEPPFWSVWFAVEDCDASAARVEELGGSIVVPPADMSFGRGAVVADPHGAVFGIGSMAPAG